MLKILHTADWHVGHLFGQFEREVSQKLARDRVTVIEQIMHLARQHDVDAVLCAGDLFDTPCPDNVWWEAVVGVFNKVRGWTKPVVMLPGNHDPLNTTSLYQPGHPFRLALPEWVHVVDHDDFELKLGDEAVVYAAPCRSTAGDRDLALTLPARAADDERIRIGVVHGSTWEMAGYDVNFPVSKKAPSERGLDYLAIGDTHSYREIAGEAQIPIVYPSAPEPTKFGETDAGYVALVTFRRRGTKPSIRRERVAHWNWRDVTIESLDELRSLVTEDLTKTVLKLSFAFTTTAQEEDEIERLIAMLRGTAAMSARVGALACDRSGLRVTTLDASAFEADLPIALRETIAKLEQDSQAGAPESPKAKRALHLLRQLLREVRS